MLQLSNGLLASSGGGVGSIKIWDPNKNYAIIKDLSGCTNWVTTLIQLSNRMLISGNTRGLIEIWNTTDGYQKIKKLEDHSIEISFLLEINYLQLLISSDKSGVIKVSSTRDNYNLRTTLNGNFKGKSSLIQIWNGHLISGSEDGSINVWDPYKNFANVTRITAHSGSIKSLKEWHNFLVSSEQGDISPFIKIWDPNENYKKVTTLTRNF